jgi:hypothetical protein
MQEKCEQNASKIQSKCKQNVSKIQAKCKQNTIEMRAKYKQNASKIQSKCKQKCYVNDCKNTIYVGCYLLDDVTEIITGTFAFRGTFCRHFVGILSAFCWHFVGNLLSFCQHFVGILSAFYWHFVAKLCQERESGETEREGKEILSEE